jgi:transposase
MSRLHLTSWQRRRLRRQLAQTREARLYRRTLAVLEFDRGRPAAEIAGMLGVARQSIYHWVEAYTQARQPAALDDDERSGRPRLLDADDEDLLEALLSVSPQDLGYPDTTWTVPRLQEALQASTGHRPSDPTLRRVLRRLGYLWKRPRYVLDPDPEREKKRRIRRQIQALPRRSVVLAEDETDLLLFPPLRATWSKRGEVARVWLSGRNARRIIFGALNLRTGARLLLPREKGRSVDFQAFLGEVRSSYRGWQVALLLDEDPCHTAQASLREAEGMSLLWLAKRSPELNPMDTLWGQGKDLVSANKQDATVDEQVTPFPSPSAESVESGGAADVRGPLQGVLAPGGFVKKLLPTCLDQKSAFLSYSPGELRSPTSLSRGPALGHSFSPRTPFTGAEGVRGEHECPSFTRPTSPRLAPAGRPPLASGSPGTDADVPRCHTGSSAPAPAAVAARPRTATGRCPRT